MHENMRPFPDFFFIEIFDFQVSSKQFLGPQLKFIYSEKATKFCEISTIDLTVTTWDKSIMDILQKFVAFSEYMNFKK